MPNVLRRVDRRHTASADLAFEAISITERVLQAVKLGRGNVRHGCHCKVVSDAAASQRLRLNWFLGGALARAGNVRREPTRRRDNSLRRRPRTVLFSAMLAIDLRGKRALVAGVADDAGFGF